jgi:hypothetical protein
MMRCCRRHPFQAGEQMAAINQVVQWKQEKHGFDIWQDLPIKLVDLIA